MKTEPIVIDTPLQKKDLFNISVVVKTTRGFHLRAWLSEMFFNAAARLLGAGSVFFEINEEHDIDKLRSELSVERQNNRLLIMAQSSLASSTGNAIAALQHQVKTLEENCRFTEYQRDTAQEKLALSQGVIERLEKEKDECANHCSTMRAELTTLADGYKAQERQIEALQIDLENEHTHHMCWSEACDRHVQTIKKLRKRVKELSALVTSKANSGKKPLIVKLRK